MNILAAEIAALTPLDTIADTMREKGWTKNATDFSKRKTISGTQMTSRKKARALQSMQWRLSGGDRKGHLMLSIWVLSCLIQPPTPEEI